MRRNSVCVILGFTLSLIASAASANAYSGSNPQPGSLTWNGSSNGSIFATISLNGNSENVLAGQFQGYFDPSSEGDGLSPDDFFRFFCIDISQFVDGGPDAYVRSLGVPDATKAAELSRLFDLFYPNVSANTNYGGAKRTSAILRTRRPRPLSSSRFGRCGSTPISISAAACSLQRPAPRGSRKPTSTRSQRVQERRQIGLSSNSPTLGSKITFQSSTRQLCGALLSPPR
jgi:hypothetical protein